LNRLDNISSWDLHLMNCLVHTTWGANQGNLFKVHQMTVLRTLRYGEEAYGSATEAVLRKLKPNYDRGRRLAPGAFAVSRTENVLCEAEMTTLREMRKLSNTKAAIQVVTKKEHPIRPFCTNPSKIDEYALRPKTPLFIRAAHSGTSFSLYGL
jgi:hypothetical protein